MGRKKRKEEDAKALTNDSRMTADEYAQTKAQEEVKEPKVVEKNVGQDLLEVLRYERKQKNNLLGKFVGDEYVIPEELKQELLLVGKKFGEFENNIVRASTILGSFVLNFRIDFEIDPDICSAKLYLIEVEQNFDEDIKHLTLLDEMQATTTLEFRDKVFEKWHVFYEGEEYAKGDFLRQYLHMQNEEYLFQKELLAILSQLFVVRMLAYLDKMGELGDKIRVDFKLAMEKYLAKDEKYAQDFSLQLYLLTQLIIKHNALEEIMKTDEGTKILQGYAGPIIKLRDKTYENAIEVTTTVKKPENRKVETSKPTVKKKSGSAAKSKPPFVLDFSKLPKTNIGKMSFGIRTASKNSPKVRQSPQNAPQPEPTPAPQPPKAEEKAVPQPQSNTPQKGDMTAEEAQRQMTAFKQQQDEENEQSSYTMETYSGQGSSLLVDSENLSHAATFEQADAKTEGSLEGFSSRAGKKTDGDGKLKDADGKSK